MFFIVIIWGLNHNLRPRFGRLPLIAHPVTTVKLTGRLGNSLRSWRYCVGARLRFWRRSRVPKKGSMDEAVFLAASPLVTAPPSNLTRLCYNGSAAKSHSISTQYRQLRRLAGKNLAQWSIFAHVDSSTEKKKHIHKIIVPPSRAKFRKFKILSMTSPVVGCYLSCTQQVCFAKYLLR